MSNDLFQENPPPSPFLVEWGRVQKERMKDKLKITVAPGIGPGVGRNTGETKLKEDLSPICQHPQGEM